MCRTLWKSCSGFGDSRRRFAQKSCGARRLAFVAAVVFAKDFRTRERARRAAAPTAPRAIAHDADGSSARRDRPDGAEGRPAMAGEGGESRASQTGRAAGGGPSRTATDGFLPATGLSPGIPGTVRRPEGVRWVLRSGQAPSWRRFGRTMAAEAVDRMRNTRRALATSFLGRQPAGDGAFGPVPGRVPWAALTPPRSRCGRWRRRARSGAGPRSHAGPRPACRRAG